MPELRGILAPIVTPFRPTDGEVDLPWIRPYLVYLRKYGCTGVIACGTNGEAASLSVSERQAVLEAVLDAAGPMPVVAGTGAAALPDAVTLTRHAFASGAAAVLVMPPFYFKRPSDAGVVAWFRHLCDAAVPPEGRVLLYHIPQTTGVPITDGILQALLTSHGDIIYGIKDSTGDPQQGNHFRCAFPGLAYFAGNDYRVGESMAGGGAGSITACANIFPDLVAAVQRAVRDSDKMQRAQEILSSARLLLEDYPLQPATKTALSEVAELPLTAVRPPQVELSAAQDADLRAALRVNLPRWRSVSSSEGDLA